MRQRDFDEFSENFCWRWINHEMPLPVQQCGDPLNPVAKFFESIGERSDVRGGRNKGLSVGNIVSQGRNTLRIDN
jgi:hypothetical protein